MKAFLCGVAFWLAACSTALNQRANAAPLPLSVETFKVVWETIRDTHFDTNFSGIDWNATRAKYLPQIESAQTQGEVRDTIQEMLDQLGHSHLMIIAGSPTEAVMAKARASGGRGGSGSIGMDVRAIGNQIVVYRVEPLSSAARAGIKPGMIIEKIDGERAADPSVSDLNKRPREFLLWHHAANLLKGSVGEICDLEFAGGKMYSLRRELEDGDVARLGNLPIMYSRVGTNAFMTGGRKRIGYIRFNLWMIPAIGPIDRFVDQYRNADGIIVDVRGNLGGIGGMVMGTAGHFVNQRASLGTMKMRDNELRFNIFPRRVDLRNRATNTFQGKLAILTDPITLSSAELFAGGLQELGRARVFGERTGGQALPAVSDRLPNGDLLYHAVADFRTPKGRRLEGNGVEPDEVIPLRIEALQAGRDEVLQAALRWMDSPLK